MQSRTFFSFGRKTAADLTFVADRAAEFNLIIGVLSANLEWGDRIFLTVGIDDRFQPSRYSHNDLSSFPFLIQRQADPGS